MALAWIGDGAPRMEVVQVDSGAGGFTAVGTQLGAVYELRYRLDGTTLALDVVGERSIELQLVDADFFDVGFSPLFNSLPVIRDGLLEAGPPRDYVMSWVDVPSLEVSRSAQRYEPLGRGVVRFTAGDFTADIEFDDAGFVLRYPGIAMRA